MVILVTLKGIFCVTEIFHFTSQTGAKVLCKLSVPGYPTNFLAYSRARAY